MTFVLHPDQEDVLHRTRVSLRTNRRVLVQAATGFGKTALGTVMGGNVVAKGKRAGWVNHRDFLIDQTSLSFDRHGVFHSYVASGRRFNPLAPAWIGSVGTLVNRLDRVVEPNYLFVDEAHHGPAKTWRRILTYWKHVKIIGLSATPWRLDGSGMDDLFDDMVCGPSVRWLIENKRLSDYRAFSLGAPDLSDVSTRAGDYVTAEVEDIMDRRALLGDMVGHYRKYADGLRAIYFAVSVAHSKHLAEAFNAAGIRALHLDAGSSTAERSAAARRFAQGDLDVLTNVDLFGEGYDLSAHAGCDVSIEAVGLARPTQSLGMHLQQIGRALRPKETPAIVLDHAGNLLRHGLPDDDREWSLKPREKGNKKKGEVSAPVKQCMTCFLVNSANATRCKYCGSEFPVMGRQAEQVDGDLKEIDVQALRRKRSAEEWSCKTVQDMIALGEARGYASPVEWAAHRWTAREAHGKKIAAERARQLRLW